MLDATRAFIIGVLLAAGLTTVVIGQHFSKLDKLQADFASDVAAGQMAGASLSSETLLWIAESYNNNHGGKRICSINFA